MFCPNCGTQNPDTALTCSKCSFNLKGASAPKFKGTMLMNQPPARPNPPASPAAPRPTGPQPGAAPSQASKLKGTMVGVGMVSPYYGQTPAAQNPGASGTPPAFGVQSNPPAPAYAPAQGAQPAPAQPMPQQAGVPYGGQPGGGFGSPPGGYAQDGGAQAFGSPGVNPMGSTIADASPPYFGPPGGPPQGSFGAPPQDSSFGSPQGGPPGQGAMGQGGYAPPPAYGQPPAPQGFGMGPSGAYGQGAGGFPPGAGGGYGQPQGPPQGNYGGPPQGYSGQPGQGFGGGGYDAAAQQGALAPGGGPGGMQVMGQDAAAGAIVVAAAPMVPAAPGVHGPKGTVRSGVMCLVLGLVTLGIYQIIWFIKCCNEISAYVQRPEPSWLKVVGLSIVTFGVYGLIWELTRCGALIQECQLRAGVPNPQNKGWLYILPYYNVVLMTNELNKAWQGPA